MKTIRLKKGCERRALMGHLWLYSNELDVSDAPLETGDDVYVEDWRGKGLGSGTFSPNSLIAVRLHAPGEKRPMDAAFIGEKVQSAAGRRERLFGEGARACRLVFGEGDGLPGVVCDRFGDFLSVQILAAGAEKRTGEILDALEEAIRPSGMVLRNDSPARDHEGLAKFVKTARGSCPEKVLFQYLGLTLSADLAGGQKTGFFFDQRENYGLIGEVSGGANVLDCFCYTGAWGLNALKYGASRVEFFDISENALEIAEENAARNGFAERSEFIAGDALEFLKDRPGPYDLVILDPPAFVKSRKRIEEARKGYMNLNKWGLRAVKPGGFLVTCSCSHHMRYPDFIDVIALAAREAGRNVTVAGVGRQGPDHPWIPAMPETEYLKVVLLAVA